MDTEQNPSKNVVAKQPLNTSTISLLILGPIIGFILGWYVAPKSIITQTEEQQIPITTTASQQKPVFMQNEVAYAEDEGNIILHYNGKFYKENPNPVQSYNQDETLNINPDKLTWTKVVAKNGKVEDVYNELFDFKLLPSKKSFLFIMRWPEKDDKDASIYHFYVYQFTLNGPGSARLLKHFTTPSESNIVPIISSISSDEQYVSLNMFGCWNCGGHHPSTAIMRLSDGTTKDIGLTSYFKWKDNGSYEYKKSVEIPCPEPEGCYGQGYEDPEKLPLQQGAF